MSYKGRSIFSHVWIKKTTDWDEEELDERKDILFAEGKEEWAVVNVWKMDEDNLNSVQEILDGLERNTDLRWTSGG